MGLFDRHAGLLKDYRDVRTTGLDPFQIRMERVLSPTEAIIDGKRTLLVGTNNYFGLTFDPSCMEAAIEAIRAEGTGTTGSRIANGSYTEHVALEQEIAEFYGKKHCMVFTTGYQANLGVISTLVGQGDFLLIDEAHSLGALGANGRGLCEEAGVLDDCHFIVGTFSKTLGAIGGYCVSDDPDFDILRVTVRAYMFTASPPPSIVASVRQALRIVKAKPELRKQLWDNVATLYDGLASQGFKLGPEHGPVVGVHLPDRETE